MMRTTPHMPASLYRKLLREGKIEPLPARSPPPASAERPAGGRSCAGGRSPPRSLAAKAAEFARAVASGRADDATVALRLGPGGCADCPHCVGSTDRVESGDKSYCGICDCPQYILSQLKSKARFKYDTCKAGRWEEVTSR